MEPERDAGPPADGAPAEGPSDGDADDALVARCGRGDGAAFSVLVDRHAGRLLRLATTVLGDAAEAEDVVQEAFLRAWREAPRWRPGRARFATWLHRVALNLAIDGRRRRRPAQALDRADAVADPAPLASEDLEAAERGRFVDAALAALPERQRAAVALAYGGTLDQAEAAAALGVSRKAFESLLSRARATLRAALAEEPGHG